MFGSVTRTLCVLLIVAGLGIGATNSPMRAQGSQIDLNADAIRLTLDQQVGKRVRLKLVSGQDLEGQVARVGSQAVSLTELAGMEFFDATVRLDQVAAVIIRRAK